MPVESFLWSKIYLILFSTYLKKTFTWTNSFVIQKAWIYLLTYGFLYSDQRLLYTKNNLHIPVRLQQVMSISFPLDLSLPWRLYLGLSFFSSRFFTLPNDTVPYYQISTTTFNFSKTVAKIPSNLLTWKLFGAPEFPDTVSVIYF